MSARSVGRAARMPGRGSRPAAGVASLRRGARLGCVLGAAVLAVVTGATPAVAAPVAVPAAPAGCASGSGGAPRPAPAAAAVVLPALLGAAVARVPAAAPAPCPPPPPSAGAATSAAVLWRWGTPTRDDEFAGTKLGTAWGVYNGPGHAGNGRRTPKAVSLRDGIMTITGDSRGDTAGMEWGAGRRYGRWEARVKAPASDPSYDAVLLLWPDAENFPVGGEIDFTEMMDPTRQRTNVFVHYGKRNRQISGAVRVDATQWHNWAVEWTPTHIATFVDGKQWWRTDRADVLPPGPMHLCVQLDWFPGSAHGPVQRSTMQVDWVKEYALGPADQAQAAAEDAAPAAAPAGAPAAAPAGAPAAAPTGPPAAVPMGPPAAVSLGSATRAPSGP